MYKNIIPSLISFDTSLKKLNGLYFSEDFDFFNKAEKSSLFHYKVEVDEKIQIPANYDFINGYFLNKGNRWYYERKLSFATLKFCFNESNNSFSFNRIFTLVPFEIGNIFPIGRQLADFINLQLFLRGYLVLFGSVAINYHGKNILIIGSSNIGKTSFINLTLDKGIKLISEAITIINLKNKIIYPRHYRDPFGRKQNQILVKKIMKNQLITKPVKLDKIFLIRACTNPAYSIQKRDFFDYVYYRSLFFLKSPFISSMIFKNNLTKKVSTLINGYKSNPVICYFKHIKNYNFYEQIIKNER